MGLGADIWFGARVMFCEGTVQPKLDLIGQALTRDLGRRYGPDVAMTLPRLLAAQPGPAPQGRRAGREARACGRSTRSAAAAGWSRTPTRGSTSRFCRATRIERDPSSRGSRLTETHVCIARFRRSASLRDFAHDPRRACPMTTAGAPCSDDPRRSRGPHARTSIPAQMRVRSVITTVDPDRAGDVVVPTGLRNARRVPAATRSCCGRTTASQCRRSARASGSTCSRGGSSPRRGSPQGVPFAEDVFRLYEQGVLRGWSIGFVPRKACRVPRAGRRRRLRVEEWDLLEYSAVPIPENPGALTVALAEGARHATRRCGDWLARIPDDRGGTWLRDADVLGELIASPVSRHRSDAVRGTARRDSLRASRPLASSAFRFPIPRRFPCPTTVADRQVPDPRRTRVVHRAADRRPPSRRRPHARGRAAGAVGHDRAGRPATRPGTAC